MKRRTRFSCHPSFCHLLLTALLVSPLAALPSRAAEEVVRAASMGFDPADSTAALQAAIDSGARKVIVENMGAPWIVDKIQLASDQEIVFEKGVVVQAKRGAFKGKGDTLFSASLKTNITLTGYGATLKMWKEDYTSAGGHRHLLSFKSCSGVRVEGLTVADSGGDGIYLGVAQKGVPCSDVLIKDVVCDNNYRQGISVISARNLLIENCTLKNTSGTPPQAGIDFEPNHASEELVNCVMRNCVSENNGGSGYEFYLRNLRQESTPISIRIENCRAIGCRSPARFIANADSESSAVTGTMEFIDCRFEGGEDGVLIGDKAVDGARVSFVNCQIVNAATERPAATPIQLSKRSTATEDLGNIHFDNLVVTDPLDRLPMSYQDMSGDSQVRDITGTLVVNGETHQLTPELVAEWMPVAAFKPIPEFDMTNIRFEPALPDATPDAARPGKARVRGPSEWLLWAGAGQDVSFAVRIGRAGKGEPAPVPVTLVAPSGKATKLKSAQGEGETDYRFQAEETGAHKIVCDPRKWTATVNSATHRVCIHAADSRIRFLSTTGEYFFWVPPDTKEFAIRVAGESNTERVKAALRDPAGSTVEEKDDIAAAHQFVGKAAGDSGGEIWSLRLDKPSIGVLDDFHIRFEGLPPVLAHTRASLLKTLAR